MKKRYQPGDIVRIPLSKGGVCYGRMYKDATIGVYFNLTDKAKWSQAASSAPDLIAGVFTTDFKASSWVICGHVAFGSEDESWPPPTYNRDIISSKPRIYYRGELRSATEEEIKGLHRQRMCKPSKLATEIEELACAAKAKPKGS